MADQYVTVRAERSKFFGQDGTYQQRGNGTTVKNIDSDFFWKRIIDDKSEAMTPKKVTVDLGGGKTSTRTLWWTRYGPVFTSLLGIPLPWTNAEAFAMKDANEDNFRAFNHFIATDQAQSTDELLGILERYQGIPSVNTIAADDAVAMCRRFEPTGCAPSSNGPVEIGNACEALAGWDKREDSTSKGALLWRRFWSRASGAAGGPWLHPFDANDPVNTPNTLNTVHPQMQTALGDAISDVRGAKIPFDAPLGSVEYVTRDGQRLLEEARHVSGHAHHPHLLAVDGSDLTALRRPDAPVQPARLERRAVLLR